MRDRTSTSGFVFFPRIAAMQRLRCLRVSTSVTSTPESFSQYALKIVQGRCLARSLDGEADTYGITWVPRQWQPAMGRRCSASPGRSLLALYGVVVAPCPTRIWSVAALELDLPPGGY